MTDAFTPGDLQFELSSYVSDCGDPPMIILQQRAKATGQIVGSLFLSVVDATQLSQMLADAAMRLGQPRPRIGTMRSSQ